MPFPMRVQPIEATIIPAPLTPAVGKPAGKPSRLKRLFEKQFPSVLRISSAAEKPGVGGGDGREREKDEVDGGLEPSSVCLDKMVQNFMEDNGNGGGGERPSRHRCNCFHSNCTDSDDEDLDLHFFVGSANSDTPAALGGDASEVLKGLALCTTVIERNLLADASKIIEKNKLSKGKQDCRKILAVELRSIGYDASVCKSHWEKSKTHPAGEYEYVDVVMDGGDRFLVDVEFRSEFEIARSTKAYRAVLQSLPLVFVGTPDRLNQIVAVVCEAARISMKKKGLSFPPWRKPDYMRNKWLSSSYTRSDPLLNSINNDDDEGEQKLEQVDEELQKKEAETEKVTMTWQPRPARERTAMAVVPAGGLASVLKE